MILLAFLPIFSLVMPHNLFLHSSIILTRNYPRDERGKASAIKYGGLDSLISLIFAFLINASILIVAAAAFYGTENEGISDIESAYKLLSPSLGASAASVLFAVALLASGQNSTISGTLSGQIVMEGFIHWRINPMIRRFLTRVITILPAVIVTIIYGARGVNDLLLISQVIISITLSFATFPLLHITSSKQHMGEKYVNSWLTTIIATLICFIIAGLNLYLLAQPATYSFSKA
jgi:manganese transport protein